MQRTSFEVVFLELQGLHLFSRAPEAVLRKSLKLKVSVAESLRPILDPDEYREGLCDSLRHVLHRADSLSSDASQ